MRIGVDARLLTYPITGIGRVLIEIGLRLSKINPDIIFYVPNEISNSYGLNIRAFKSSVLKSKVFDKLWFQSILPYWAKEDKVDVFWGPAHRIPYFLPKNIVKVLTVHDLVWKHHPLTMKITSLFYEQITMPYSLRSADKVMVVSNATARDVREEFPAISKKLSVINLGSSLPSPGPAFEKNYGFSHDYILFVGTLEPRKNLIRLLEGYSRLPASLRLRHDLVIVGGDGWGKSGFHKAKTLSALDNGVHFLGYVSEDDLAWLYQNAIFLAMPSLYEGFGLPIIEAMSFGTPVLTSNCSSMPEIAGNAALLIDPYSTKSIAAGMEKLLLDHQLRASMSFNARKNAIRFSWEKSAEKLLSLFDEALTERQRNST
jgi:glycosyltransferase involved in cell wall biosynthesis